MSNTTTATFFITVGLLLNCCGCPTPPGSDPEVWQDLSIKGLAELVSVATSTDGGTEVSIRFTYDDGRVDERPIEGLKLTTINDLPDEYEPNVGDQLRLQLDLRYQRKMSVGPPDFLHGDLKSRTYTCLELIKSESNVVSGVVLDPSGTGDQVANSETVFGDNKSNTHRLVWETTGGGQIRFTITPLGNDYQIQVDEYGPYQKFDLKLTATDSKPFNNVKLVFDKWQELRFEPAAENDETSTKRLVGTWTSVVMFDSEGSKFELNRSSNKVDFESIYNFVNEAGDKNIKPLPDEFSPPSMPVEKSDGPGSKAGQASSADLSDAGASARSKLVSDIGQAENDSPAGEPYRFKQLNWVTEGGGQIEFSITPENEKFKVRLESYGFRELKPVKEFQLEKGKAYSVVASIFTKKHELRQRSLQPGALTGSWTTITLIENNDKQDQFINISANGDLHEIYLFVADAAEKAGGENDEAPSTSFGAITIQSPTPIR